MLIYSKERLMPSNINMMVLKDENGGYYYIHRSLYDQAVIIEDRYKDNPEAIIRGLGKNPEEYHSINVANFVSEVPKPINILGYFLYLIDGIHSTVETIEVLCGAVHVMSSILNFRQFLKTPKEIRASVSFSLSIREEYEVSWDRFFQEAIPYGSTVERKTVYTAPKTETELTIETAETDEDFLALLDEEFDIDLSLTSDNIIEETVDEEPQPQTDNKKSGPLSRLRGM